MVKSMTGFGKSTLSKRKKRISNGNKKCKTIDI